jgi:hypothetical protein
MTSVDVPAAAFLSLQILPLTTRCAVIAGPSRPSYPTATAEDAAINFLSPLPLLTLATDVVDVRTVDSTFTAFAIAVAAHTRHPRFIASERAVDVTVIHYRSNALLVMQTLNNSCPMM